MRDCAIPEFRRDGMHILTSGGAVSNRSWKLQSWAYVRMRVASRFGEIPKTAWVSRSFSGSGVTANGKVACPNPRNRVNRRVVEERQCWYMCRSDVGSTYGVSSPRSVMPLVPYRMDSAMGVVNAVQAVVLGSRRPRPPFFWDWRASALECVGMSGAAAIFDSVLSVSAMIRFVKGPFQLNGSSKSVEVSAWWYISAGRRWGALARTHFANSWIIVWRSSR
jgi:hypothetical protein